ncbi:hypothetical protein O9992_21525 [Vibrio lentus]|nr:hypothetical protein [Vibrio lentus]
MAVSGQCCLGLAWLSRCLFKMPPTSPPVTVMLIILAVVTCASISKRRVA